MKTKINILCALVFVTLVLYIAPVFYYVSSVFASGFEAGFKEQEAALDKVNSISEYRAVTIYPTYRNILEMEEGKVKNDVTGKEVNVIPIKMMVNVRPEKAGLYNAIEDISVLILFILSIAVIATFIKFIINVNHKKVFTQENLKLLRRIGWCLIAIAGLHMAAGIIEEYLVSEVFKVKGYETAYVEYLYTSDILVGIVTLIIAEAFAIGLKQKEELELTV